MPRGDKGSYTRKQKRQAEGPATRSRGGRAKRTAASSRRFRSRTAPGRRSRTVRSRA